MMDGQAKHVFLSEAELCKEIGINSIGNSTVAVDYLIRDPENPLPRVVVGGVHLYPIKALEEWAERELERQRREKA